MSGVDEASISVRFKHGIHTIYLFVDTLGPISWVRRDLLDLLRERYPAGLTSSIQPPRTTSVPAKSSDVKVVYGVLNVPNDPTRGWKRLKIDSFGDKNALDTGLKQNGIVAFQFLEDGDDEEDVEFEVEWPKDEEEAYE